MREEGCGMTEEGRGMREVIRGNEGEWRVGRMRLLQLSPVGLSVMGKFS